MSSCHDDFKEICKFLNKTLDLIQYTLCFRCGKNLGVRPNVKAHHHCGRINNHMSGKTTLEQLSNWEKDIEHGLFHGFSTALMAGLVINDEFETIKEKIALGGEHLFVKMKNLSKRTVAHKVEDLINPKTYSDYDSRHSETKLSFEQLVSSCLLHDFAKCNGIIESHDSALISTFDDLCDETYIHANPIHHNHPLLIADVLELRRYPDSKNWYNPDVVEKSLSSLQRHLIDIYYRCVRPALEFGFKNKDQLWLAHGPEVKPNLDLDRFPQALPWSAIEIDRLAFRKCLLHDHEWGAPWGKIRGVMPLTKVKELNGNVKPHGEFFRDHLYLNINSTWKDWMFVIDENAVTNLEWVDILIEHLLKNNVMMVDLRVLNKFIETIQTIRDRIFVLNI